MARVYPMRMCRTCHEGFRPWSEYGEFECPLCRDAKTAFRVMPGLINVAFLSGSPRHTKGQRGAIKGEVPAETLEGFVDQLERGVRFDWPEEVIERAGRAVLGQAAIASEDIDAWAERLAQSAAEMTD